jgi:hypothetical protein
MVADASDRFGLRDGAVKVAAADVGITYGTAKQHLRMLRSRLGVATTQTAVQWLDEHQPGWSD